MSVSDITVIWIFAFFLCYALIYEKGYKLLGAAFMFVNGLLGVYVLDHWIGFFIWGITCLNLAYEIFKDTIIKAIK